MSDPLMEFAEVWSDGDLANNLADKLTCNEAEAIASLFLSIGKVEAADAWMKSHELGDDCGDMHCICDDEECIKEREGSDETGNDQPRG
ncbi:hypothetical protein KIV65_gp22 [Mycobacterium phage Anthony]|uniref:Uncharacterized protein n=1 Tax=Mycobacterium phage Anthony TaxID=2599857 RepID=A0A5J6TIA1_9CAUD|nr:hypothetical protein KIV65_gp22 [Mycobacterium phage Anthony]QFG10445.1 hypothetical protein PBI_ANTHONY_75 [Mycobacterium phage Anthony]